MLEEKEINKGCNMQEAKQQFAVDLAVKAMDTYTVERDIARYIKNKFDETYGSNWHCIVGKNFGRKHEISVNHCESNINTYKRDINKKDNK
ncbi:unnamed protein product [Schistosoma margrebowiei]|uniref:Dynein light chain n=1 Tax=Schistosoma margrebowiei TaxID=48269 RepID=A0AA84ZSK9_9TREM|nr:unnamed protein product [Schistosoma margrebowiei]